MKTQLHKIGKSGGFLGRRLETLLKTGLNLIGNLFQPLAKSILIALGLKAAASATDRYPYRSIADASAAIHKKMFGSGFITLVIFNKEITDIMKIVS